MTAHPETSWLHTWRDRFLEAGGVDLDDFSRASTRRPPDFSAWCAGICVARGAALATRNERDFEGTGLHIINPWASSADAPAPRGSGSSRE